MVALTNILLQKSPTGIPGLDDISGGGLPKGRPTLVCGGAGSGKTLLAIAFLANGALRFNEPGVLISFEESAEELACNVASLGYNLPGLIAARQLAVDHVHINRDDVVSGEFNLEGLFVRIGHAIDSIGAARVALDSIETIFSGFTDQQILRSELRRLFEWLKEKKVTAIVTTERGETSLTRQGLEEYISDCVIVLDHRIQDQVSTRRLHILKYRGSTHGTNEYPFLIDSDGISVLPITSLGLEHPASTERVSSGVERLDAMLNGQGYYRGSSVLITGTAGSGKTSLAAHFADASCARGERVQFFVFEESALQIRRNMLSIGLDLDQWVTKGLLQIIANRPTFYGLEMHLAMIHKSVQAFNPQVVICDPLNTFLNSSDPYQAGAMLMRLVDFLKSQQITALFTSLISRNGAQDHIDLAISSLIDTWISLRETELNGERNRTIYVLKSRGMAHSNQVREFLLTDHGVRLLDAYIGPSGVLTGSARLAQDAREKALQMMREQEIEKVKRDLQRKRSALEAQMAQMRADFEAEELETLQGIAIAQQRETRLAMDRQDMARMRDVDGQ